MNILFIYQGINDIEGMKNGLAMAKAKVDISIFTTPTHKTFTSEKYPSGSVEVNNVISINPTEILKEVTGKYDVVCLFYDWNTINPRPTNPAHHNFLLGGCTPIQIPLQFVSNEKGIIYPEVLCQFFLHELAHAKSFLMGKPDRVHFQYATPEWSQKPPTDYYVHLINELGAFLPPTEPIRTVILTRRWDNGVQTLGELSFDDFNCKTLELPYRDNKQNISCIPKGTYTVKWSFSPKFMKYTYEILKVPNRSGIRFHSGSSFYDIKGCIILGTHYTDINGDPYADIANTKETITRFDSLLKKKDFKLIIR